MLGGTRFRVQGLGHQGLKGVPFHVLLSWLVLCWLFGITVLPEARAEGLWFLKHSTMDRNEGVTCFKGHTAADSSELAYRVL